LATKRRNKAFYKLHKKAVIKPKYEPLHPIRQSATANTSAPKQVNKVNEEELHRAQMRVQDIAKFPEENPFPVLRISQKGVILYSNNPGRRLLESWGQDIGQTAPEKWRKLVQDALDSGQPKVVEFELQGRIVSFVLAPVADGEYVNLYGRDITTFRRYEEKLRQHAQILDQIHDSVVITNLDGNITSWNKGAERIFGFTSREAVGKHISFLYLSEEHKFIDKEMIRTLKKTGFFELEAKAKRKTGEVIDIHISLSMLKDKNGQPTGLIGYSTDITERKRAEIALRQSRENLDRAQQVGSIGSWRLDTRRNELTWSDENHRIFGIPKGTPMTYETFLSTVHPGDREYVDTKWKAGLAGEPYDVEHRIIVDGQIKWVREKAYLEFDNKGALLGGFGITQDITERKQMLEELRRSHDELEKRVQERTADLDEAVVELQKQVEHRIAAEERVTAERQRLNDVLETLPAYVCLLTHDYRMPFANKVFREWFGYQPDKKCYEFLFNRKEPCETCETYTVLKTNKPHHWEWTGPNGRIYDIYDYPFKDTDGSQLILEMGMDMTEKKEAQQALHSSALYMRGLLEASPDPLVTISEEGKITDVNKATETATGLSRASLINTDFSDYFNDPEKARQVYKKVLSEGQVKDYPLTINHITGRTTDVLYNATVYKNEEGVVQGVFAAARDVTEHNRADARARITNALLELFAQKNSRMEYLDSVVKAIHNWSGCECVGIRLTNDDGFIPFESCIGYSEEFLSLENMLCLKTDTCACIRAISQTPEPQDAPLLTARGSFTTNNSFDFANSLDKKGKQRYRANCMRFGFASLAIIPIRYRDEILGAIHLADKKENKMPAETVEFLENMAMLIGEAVHRFNIETEMRESEQRYRQLVELSPDGIGMERDDRILFVNTAGAKLLGANKPEELIGRSILDFVHPDYRRRTQRQLEYLRRKQKAIPLREDKFIRADGMVLDVEVAATPLLFQNKPATQIVFRDITERKLAEEKIFADQKQLRKLTAELVLAEERERHAIATAMHDSIGPILAFTKRELSALRKTAPSKIAEALENIGLNISEVVTQTRTLTFDLSPPTLYTLGFEMAVGELTERFCEEHKLEHSFSKTDESKPLTDHIKVLLYRSIRELLVNIAKHAKAEFVKVDISRIDDDIRVTIEDDGKGFDVSAMSTGATRPTGLGLFSIRERLTHIGGKLEIESGHKHKKGTRITLTAPLKLD
jgi:PAS domain S-box-containing protein